MSGRKDMLVTFGLVVSVSLIASALTAMFVSAYDSRNCFALLNGICGEVAEQEAEAKQIIAAALKEYTDGNADEDAGGEIEDDILSSLGYRIADFSGTGYRQNAFFTSIGLLAGSLLFIFTFCRRNQLEAKRIRALADYLEQVNTGKAIILSTSGEDDFSKLEDEIYKTVTFLFQTKEAAVQAKNGFAKNLSNIAHQLKTPITAMSLTVQMMKQEFANIASAHQVRNVSDYPEQMEKQLLRLSHLEEALLVLARIDAGTLPLQEKETDVYTMLVLAADNLSELLAGSGIAIDIPELGEMMVAADLDWTMEAIMNLMKNCMEHSNGDAVHCSYAQNPLYTQILIWDDGKGFAKEDMPHLFERFYRGKDTGEGGIGIGLALAKEIIERQNGTIRASNKEDGGALFEIRFYSH